MRLVVVVHAVVVLGLAGCTTRQNPNVCCQTEQQCREVGFEEPQPCGAGQACSADHTCVAAECQRNADCNDDEPVCRNGFCESTCAVDEDCADVAGRTRCLEQVCVGCTESSQCPASAAICDSQTHACRGCNYDDECASGVCLETSGLCADEANILYVGKGTDSGACTKNEPCRTIGYAYSKVGISSRNIIRVSGGAISLDPSTVSVSSALVIDGTGTMINKPAGICPGCTSTRLEA